MVATYAAYADPTSGAAKALVDTVSMLRAAGWRCSARTGPRFDRNKGFQPRDVATYLRDQGLRPKATTSLNVGVKHQLIHYRHEETPVIAFVPRDSGTGVPSAKDAAAFVAWVERELDANRPDVLVTYGGGRYHEPIRGILDAAARRRIPVVFWLRNEHYTDLGYLDLFRMVSGIVVPSRFLGEYYADKLGIRATRISSPVKWDRVLAPADAPRDALVFVNPSVDKGARVAARIFEELQRRAPRLPLLVVESRAGAEELFASGAALDRGRIEVMANTSDPRDFFRRTRVLLCPSVWTEASLRLGVEGMINGVPVVASTRGGIPETLARAGILLDLPRRALPPSRALPTADEVRPWVDVLLRLWEDQAFYESECRRAQSAREAFAWGPLSEQVVSYFSNISLKGSHE